MRTMSSLLVTKGATYCLLLRTHSRNVRSDYIQLNLYIESFGAQRHPIPGKRLVRKFMAEGCDQSSKSK